LFPVLSPIECVVSHCAFKSIGGTTIATYGYIDNILHLCAVNIYPSRLWGTVTTNFKLCNFFEYSCRPVDVCRALLGIPGDANES